MKIPIPTCIMFCMWGVVWFLIETTCYGLDDRSFPLFLSNKWYNIAHQDGPGGGGGGVGTCMYMYMYCRHI